MEMSYESRVQAYEADGLTTSDAQAVCDAEDLKAAPVAPAKISKGAILYSSWGCDQTNIDFYEVQEDCAVGKMVKLRQLKQTTTETGFMCGNTFPVLGEYAGEMFRKKLKSSAHYGFACKLTSYAHAFLWDGAVKRCSWYA